ncbi:ABC transporter substrate-binding protein [Leptolyngbya sp. FACHB-671]|uniref:ABC transporter substrate-binding protein n=1 Tax=Leptolyngbya sp. FACHB-671 TaxID=2692812 RepID=UPI001681CA51|nr:ABC transporter substrate-binding protein [Leptolyngbya sp. FACHB-671]MBD2072255.1 ABC transporter substrate-binding protein [Leptolyngbya sp. FACHB-671]
MGQKPQIFTRRLSRRQAMYLMGGFAGGMTLHACAQSTPTTSEASSEATDTASAPAEPVAASTGSTLWIGYSPLYVALEKGFFEEGGLDLTYNVFSASAEADAAFASNQIQGQNNVTSEAVALAAKGQDYRIIQVADSSLGGDGILARNSIADIAAFKGKEIAVEIGAVSHFFLLQVLEEAGLTADDVTILNVTPDAAAAAYQAGQIDIAVTYSPFLKQANDAQSDGRIIYDTSKMPAAILDVYIFSPQFLEENPTAGEAFVSGIFKGIEFLKTNPDEAYAIVGDRLELAPEDVGTELKGVDLTSLEKNIEMLSNPDSDIYLAKHLQSLGEFLVTQEQIPEAPADLEARLEPKYVQALQTSS